MRILFSHFLFLTTFLTPLKAHDVEVYRFSCPESKIAGKLPHLIYNEINKELARDEIRIDLIAHPMLRALVEIDKGLLDGDVGRTYNLAGPSDYRNIYRLSEYISNLSYRVVLMKDSPVKLYKDFRQGAHAGFIRGGINSSIIAQNHTAIEAADLDQLSLMLEKSRIDYFVLPQLEEYPLLLPSTEKFNLLNEPIGQFQLAPTLNSKYKDTKFEKKLKAAIKKLREDGTFKKVIKSVLAPSSQYSRKESSSYQNRLLSCVLNVRSF